MSAASEFLAEATAKLEARERATAAKEAELREREAALAAREEKLRKAMEAF
jgi:hypothetical protein